MRGDSSLASVGSRDRAYCDYDCHQGAREAGLEVYGHLRSGNIAEARRSLSMVVGRDTGHLDEPEIVRGTVETVAENIVDAVIAPLFLP